MIKVKCSRKKLKELLPTNRLRWSTKHYIYYDDILDYFIIEYWAKKWVIVLTSPIIFLASAYEVGLKGVSKEFSSLLNMPIGRDTSGRGCKLYDEFNKMEKYNEI